MEKILELLNIPMLIEPDAFQGFLNGVRILKAGPQKREDIRHMAYEGKLIDLAIASAGAYSVTSGGIAIIGCFGPMFDGYGAWGYADQSEIRASVEMAAADPNVGGIMMVLDTPGGSVSGTADLADAVNAVSQSKPLHAYVQNMCASAGMWVASQANVITAGRTSTIGSVGVITSLVDATKFYEGAGIKVVNVATGNLKDIGSEARQMSQADIDYVRAKIEAMFAHFLDAVAKGRNMRAETVRKMEAAIYVGQGAVDAKLIDGIGGFADAMKGLGKAMKQASGNRRAKAMQKLAEMPH